MVDARQATRAQINNAAGWCTNQVATVGWTGASKIYDDYNGQTEVCFIHFPYDNTAVALYADPTYGDMRQAEEYCREIAPNSNVISWYP